MANEIYIADKATLDLIKTDTSAIINNTTAINTNVNTANTNIGTANTGINTANTAITAVKAQIVNVQADTDDLQLSATTLKADTAIIKGNEATLAINLATANTNINTINSSMGTVNSNVTTAITNIIGVKADTASILSKVASASVENRTSGIATVYTSNLNAGNFYVLASLTGNVVITGISVICSYANNMPVTLRITIDGVATTFTLYYTPYQSVGGYSLALMLKCNSSIKVEVEAQSTCAVTGTVFYAI